MSDTDDIELPDLPEESSLRETLADAYDNASEDDKLAAADPESAEERSARADRERDEHGRFKPKSKDIQASTSDTDKATEQLGTQVKESAPSLPPVLPPQSWAADAKEVFNQLPPRLQHEVSKRESDRERHLSQESGRIAQGARTYAEIDEVLAPRREEFARNGVTPGQVVGQFMAWQNHLDSDPVQGLRDLAQSYGLDLRQLAQYEAERPQEPPYVRELRQQYQQLTGFFTQQQQAAAQQQQQSVVAEVSAFAAETDASGNPLRPYIEHVVDDMLPILQYLRTTSPHTPPRQLLQQAYEKAIWANPSTRELEIKRASPAPNRQSVEKAKRAAKLVNGDARGAVTEDNPGTVRGALEAAYERLSG